MPFIQKWIWASGGIMAFLFVLSFFATIIRGIPIHPSVIFSERYREKYWRDLFWAIIIFPFISILLGLIVAAIWEAVDPYIYFFFEAVHGPLLCQKKFHF